MEGENRLTLRLPAIKEVFRNYLAEKITGATRLNVDVASVHANTNATGLLSLDIDFKINAKEKTPCG